MAKNLSDDPESAFGFIASTYRKRRGYSQKEMAEKLTALGMKVDASAVSRLEAGGRALRLAEVFKVAEALDVSVESLLTFSSTPATRLRDARDRLDSSWKTLRQSVVLFLHHLEEVEDQLAETPELLSSLRDRELGQPKSATDYPAWMLARLERIASEERQDMLWKFDETYLVQSEEAKADKVQMVQRLVANFIDVGEYPYDDNDDVEGEDGEH